MRGNAKKMKAVLASNQSGRRKIHDGDGCAPKRENLGHHRYCQALMLARRGEKFF
jgi:uncharacterized protein (DUF169 family)